MAAPMMFGEMLMPPVVPGAGMPPLPPGTQGIVGPLPAPAPPVPGQPPVNFGVDLASMQGMWNPDPNAQFGMQNIGLASELIKDNEMQDKLAEQMAQQGIPPPNLQALAAGMSQYSAKNDQRAPKPKGSPSVNVGGPQGNPAALAALLPQLKPRNPQVSPIGGR